MEGYYRNQLELYNKIKNAFSNFSKLGQAKMTHGQAIARQKQLDSAFKNFEQVHELIMSLTGLDTQHEYFKSNLFAKGEDLYYTNLGNFVDHMTNIGTPQLPVNSAPTGSLSTASSLPNIELPHFSGDREEWPNFRDVFRALVHNKTEISLVIKHHFLRTQVKGEAADLIKNIPLTADNYQQAWTALVDYYDNPRRLVSSYVKSIIDASPMKNSSALELKQLISQTVRPLSALESLNRAEHMFGDLFIGLVSNKLDFGTIKDWQKHLSSSTTPPTLQQFVAFLNNQLIALESFTPRLKPHQVSQPVRSNKSHDKTANASASHQTTSVQNCPCCNGYHNIRQCESFKSKPWKVKKLIQANSKLCLICLGPHKFKDCKSDSTCKICKQKHHFLMHRDDNSSPDRINSLNVDSSKNKNGKNTQVVLSTSLAHVPSSVLLATARVIIVTPSGQSMVIRALIDPCSQVSLISRSLAQLLQLSCNKTNVRLTGLGGKIQTLAKQLVHFTIKPHFEDGYSLDMSALVIQKVSSYKPPTLCSNVKLNYIKGLLLADPCYYNNDSVDLLLDAAAYAAIIEGPIIKNGPNHPVALKSSLGWLLSGSINSSSSSKNRSLVSLQICNEPLVDNILQKFWEVEEIPHKVPTLTKNEIECEKFFRETYSRDELGRFIVKLPFKSSLDSLQKAQEESYHLAKAMFHRLEFKFRNNPKLHESYRNFMRDYLDSNHMIPQKESVSGITWYLPHHGVWRESSATTKLRVVFNGSATSPSGVSLNSCLHTGPNLLPTLFDLILKWRSYRFVFTADAVQMFRQVKVAAADQPLQSILWRDNPENTLQTFHLSTVTYGLVSSPYLALRVLKELASHYNKSLPLGAKILENEVYMDDFISGAHSEVEAKQKIVQLKELTNFGGFPLHKWSSNSFKLLEDIPVDQKSVNVLKLTESEDVTSVLGLSWDSNRDCFSFKVDLPESFPKWTKRTVLSQIAKFFDPLGWVAPVLIKAKMLMQELWLLKMSWDDQLPPVLYSEWCNWISEASALNKVIIPRWNHFQHDKAKIEIHGFSDASKRAYAAVIYLRVVVNCEILVSLEVAKTKVAPIKTISIPRLELCGAQLLAKLVHHYIDTTGIDSSGVHLWTDSKNVLYWISSVPSRWPTFVANRCSEIQTLNPTALWHHVPSKKNPADIASRGIAPLSFLDQRLWFDGPKFLHELEIIYPKIQPEGLNEEEPVADLKVNVVTQLPNHSWSLYYNYSSWHKLLRVTSICMRFVYRLMSCCALTSNRIKKSKSQGAKVLSTADSPFLDLTDVLTAKNVNIKTSELNNARLFWSKEHQKLHFQTEYQILLKNSTLPIAEHTQIKGISKLVKLYPILVDGIIRVGGRISQALLPGETKHPIILSSNDHLTSLVIRYHHELTLHGYTQATLSSIRRMYWILRGRQTVKNELTSCLSCTRYAAHSLNPLMGDLPVSRVQETPAFSRTGVDYAGPINIRLSKTRGKGTMKGYIAVFVCMTTKAVHLEPVEDYTSQAFIAAFNRFVSRRGQCLHLYSDRGTNFIGASSEMFKALREFQSTYKFCNQLLKLGTNWSFNPPAAPHFGGLWEAAVKSTKYHFKRLVGEQVLTFVEFSTLLCRIEACLNSRPLVPLSDDPFDLEVLTPAHFLSYKPAYLMPEPELDLKEFNPLRRWKFISSVLQQFWNRWSTEYLISLQTRQKWYLKQRPIRLNDLVLIRLENTPPGHWPLGRVVEVFAGSKDTIRVARIRTASSTFTRPLVKLVLLIPSEEIKETEGNETLSD